MIDCGVVYLKEPVSLLNSSYWCILRKSENAGCFLGYGGALREDFRMIGIMLKGRV